MKTKVVPASKIGVNYYPKDNCIKLYRNHRPEVKINGATAELAEILKDLIRQGDYNSFVSMYGEKSCISWLVNVISYDRSIADHFKKVVVK